MSSKTVTQAFRDWPVSALAVGKGSFEAFKAGWDARSASETSVVQRLCTCTHNRRDGQPHMATCSRYGIPDETTCEWSEIEDGSGIFNTCKSGEEWHVPEGLEPFPFCHWCGKRIVIAEQACTECGARWGEHRAGCSQIDPADLQVKSIGEPSA